MRLDDNDELLQIHCEQMAEVAGRIDARFVGKNGLLTGEGERVLFHRLGGLEGEEARLLRGALASINFRLVFSISMKYINKGVDLKDLIQEGTIGLLKAIEKFDINRGFKLSTYASYWIRQAVGRALADQANTIRVPVHFHDKVKTVFAVRARLTMKLEGEPTVEEIVAETGFLKDDVVLALKSGGGILSLETPICRGEGDDRALGDTIESEGVPPDVDAETEIMAERIREILERLPHRECQILQLRYGIGRLRAHTLEEVGEMFGLTRERIRQIEAGALKRLRHPRILRGLRGFCETDVAIG